MDGRLEVEESESEEWTLLVEKSFFVGEDRFSVGGFVEYGSGQAGDQRGRSQTGGNGRRKEPWMT